MSESCWLGQQRLNSEETWKLWLDCWWCCSESLMVSCFTIWHINIGFNVMWITCCESMTFYAAVGSSLITFIDKSSSKNQLTNAAVWNWCFCFSLVHQAFKKCHKKLFLRAIANLDINSTSMCMYSKNYSYYLLQVNILN